MGACLFVNKGGRSKMTPEKFARGFIGLNIPLTEEEWYGLSRLLEKISPGITGCLGEAAAKPRYEFCGEAGCKDAECGGEL